MLLFPLLALELVVRFGTRLLEPDAASFSRADFRQMTGIACFVSADKEGWRMQHSRPLKKGRRRRSTAHRRRVDRAREGDVSGRSDCGGNRFPSGAGPISMACGALLACRTRSRAAASWPAGNGFFRT